VDSLLLALIQVKLLVAIVIPPSCFFYYTTEKNKRNLLHGGHCSEELDILRAEIRRHGTLPPFSRIKELSHPRVYLSNQCQILLKSKKELESKLQSKIKEIDLRLGLLAERMRERNRKKPMEDIDEDIEVIVRIWFHHR